jgi:hypothetical protein
VLVLVLVLVPVKAVTVIAQQVPAEVSASSSPRRRGQANAWSDRRW